MGFYDLVNLQRTIYSIIFATCVGLLGFGLYLEHAVGLEPCPLCVFQRIAYILIAILSLVGVIHNPKNFFAPIYSSLIFIISVCGAGIAGRQIWLQHLPEDKIPECGPGLEYILDVFPIADALKMILSGSGECAEVLWLFLGFSIAEWSVLCFISLSVASLTMLVRQKMRSFDQT